MDLQNLFHAFKMIKAFDNTQFTADASNTLVLDRRTYAPNVRVGLLLTANLAATADATNYFDFAWYEAAEKTSTTALTSGTIVAAADVSGWSRNGTLDENSLTWPRINYSGSMSCWSAYCRTIDSTRTVCPTFHSRCGRSMSCTNCRTPSRMISSIIPRAATSPRT